MHGKRWKQLRIRGLMLLMVLVALGIVTYQRLRARDIAKAVAFNKIEQHGGVFGYKLGSVGLYRNLMVSTGVDERAYWETKYFLFPPYVDPQQYKTPFDDKLLQEISPCFEFFPKLESLEFPGCKYLTDAGVASLPTLPRLKLIDLEGTSVTGNGVRALQDRFPNTEIKH